MTDNGQYSDELAAQLLPARKGQALNMIGAYKALAGKIGVVVGGAHGVGRAITLALAEAGIHLAVCDNDEQSLGELDALVEPFGIRLVTAPADVCDVDALDAFYDKVESEFDQVDILVNVAGGTKRNDLLDTTRERNATDIRLNYGYVIDSVRRALPLIRKTGTGGAIVNFTTIEAHRGAASLAVYAGAKAATTNFSKAMAVELAREGIRVNLIAPDTTPSRTNMSSLAPEDMARFAKLNPETPAKGMQVYIPQGVSPTQEDLANAVVFLVSDMACAITGITLHVDGGTMASAGFLNWPFGDGYSPAPMPETMARLFES